MILIPLIYGSGDYDDGSGPVLRNPFNFSDRAVQTISRPSRVIIEECTVASY